MKPKARIILVLSLVAVAVAVWWTNDRPDPVRGGKPQAPETAGNPGTPSVSAGEALPLPRTKHLDRPDDASRSGKLDDDFQPANYQRRTMGDVSDSVAGAAIAYVQVPSSNLRAALPPNPLGEYEAQSTLTGETVGIRMRIEDVSPGTPVSVVILDGGVFPGETGPSKVIKLGGKSEISFQFTTSANIGHHRIRVLPSGGKPRIFDFVASES